MRTYSSKGDDIGQLAYPRKHAILNVKLQCRNFISTSQKWGAFRSHTLQKKKASSLIRSTTAAVLVFVMIIELRADCCIQEVYVQTHIGTENQVVFDKTSHKHITIVFRMETRAYIPYTSFDELIKEYVTRMINVRKMCEAESDHTAVL